MRHKKVIFFIFVFALLVFLLSLMRANIDKTTLLEGFDFILTRIISGLWGLVSNPIIFISLVVVIAILYFHEDIVRLIPGIKELKAGSISLVFSPQDSGKTTLEIDNKPQKLSNKEPESLSDKVNLNSQLSYEDNLISVLNRDLCKFVLNLDQRLLHVDQVVGELQNLGFYSPKNAASLRESIKANYYLGVFKVLDDFVIRPLLTRKLSDDIKTAYFELKTGVREKLTKRIEDIENAEKQ